MLKRAALFALAACLVAACITRPEASPAATTIGATPNPLTPADTISPDDSATPLVGFAPDTPTPGAPPETPSGPSSNLTPVASLTGRPTRTPSVTASETGVPGTIAPTPLIHFQPNTPTVGPTVNASLSPTPSATPTPLIVAPPPQAFTVGRYTVFEHDFVYPSSLYTNPWDDATLMVTFIAPSGAQTVMGGFFYDVNTWKVRFAPTEAGHYTWRSEFTDKFGGAALTDAGELNAIDVGEHGFVRISDANRFRFIFSDGTPYYPVGLQDCTDDRDHSGNPFDDFGFDGGPRPSNTDLGSKTDINHYLDAYGAAGFNLWRWGAENCGFKLWDQISPDGNLYIPQGGLWGDQLVTTLRSKGFRIYANIFAFNPPFPQDSGDALKMNAVKRYVRYFVSRYAAYVDFWDLMNEANANDDWINLVAGMVREADPYDHPIAISWERPDLIVIDINSPHWFLTEPEFDADRVAADKIAEQQQRWRKPIVFSEQGNSGVNWDPTSATRMRLHAWTAFFEEATLIFWNSSFGNDYHADLAANIYLGPEERGYIRALQNFTAGFDPAATPENADTTAPERVRGYALRSRKAYAAYLVNYTDHTNPTSGVKLTASLPVSGAAIWYDPKTGATVSTVNISAGKRTLNVPDFVTDIALKISG
ncbi:MAG: DUF5060 domain-containing protein [Chloroflexi bacterium]|nr:DUF5060 domain-containing protein [Chloroflexota bacterium]